MSDSVANVEVEDVISSIRRLFSDDKRPQSASTEETHHALDPLDMSPEDHVEQEKPRDALVLTPAFRVSEGREKPKESATVATPLFSRSVDSEAPAPKADDETTAIFTHSSDPLVLHKPINAAHLDAEVQSASDDIRADISRAQSRLEATIAELEAAISGQPNDFEPDGSEIAGSSPETQPVQTPSELDAELARAMAPAEQPIDIAFMRQRRLQETPAVTPLGNEAVNDDHVESFVENQSEEPTEDLPVEKAAQQMPAEEATFDEEALRELVSELVRHELQGALGERITRNVRKLVRREIHRIVSSPDFD